MEAEWRIDISIKLAIIGSDNALSPIWRQAIIIIKTSGGLLTIGTQGQTSTKFESKCNTFHRRESWKFVVWKMATPSSRPYCVDINNKHRTAQNVYISPQHHRKHGIDDIVSPA